MMSATSHALLCLYIGPHRYAPILYLVQDSVARAQAFKHMLQVAAEQDAAASAPASSKDGAALGHDEAAAEKAEAPKPSDGTAAAEGATAIQAADAGSNREGVEEKEGGEEAAGDSGWDEVEEPLLGSSQEQAGDEKGDTPEAKAAAPAAAAPAQAKVSAALASLQAHAAKRMAELTTAQVQLLCDHAGSLSISAR
jgi:hypothetical protein